MRRAILLLILVGCGQPSTPPTLTEILKQVPPDPRVSAAVMEVVNSFLSGNWGFETIYIEASPFVPADLSRIGPNKAEVLTKDEFIRRHEGTRYAPGLVRLRVRNCSKHPTDQFVVTVIYGGIQTKEGPRGPLGGGREWAFRLDADAARVIKKSGWVE